MRPEYVLLGLTLLLALGHVLAAAHVRTRQLGLTWNMGARDDPTPPPTPLGGRLQRAQANLFETLPLFIGSVTGAGAVGHLGHLSLIGAQLYFWGRVAYLPLYAAGVPLVRTLAWAVATLGLLLGIGALLFG